MPPYSWTIRLAPLLGVLAATACSSPPAPKVAATPATAAPATSLYSRIPGQIGAFRLTERASVRGLPTDSLFRFRDGSPAILTVIIYDVSADVKVGDDPQKWTQREGEKFRLVQDIRVRQGQLGAYQLAFSDTTRIAAGGQHILEHSIVTPIRFPSGRLAVDMQYLYLISGKFVKVRATIPEQGWQQTQVPAFARELMMRLAGST